MNRKLLSLPFIFWSAMFVIVPLCMVFYYGLTDKSGAFTFDNILAIATAEHSKALWEALKLSVISTVICLLLAYPLAMILCNMNVNQNSFPGTDFHFAHVDEFSASYPGMADSA